MHTPSLIASALLALAPAVQAVGNAIIYNECDFDVFMWAVSVGEDDGPTKISSNGGKFSQQYKMLSKGGMSLKLSKTDQCTNITQMEYTLGSTTVWYDISNVNCDGTKCPFHSKGMYMESGSGCPTVTCPAGNATCGGAYTNFNDDWASKACTPDADTTLYLCSTSAGGSSDSGSTSVDAAGYIGSSTPAPSSSSSTPSSSAKATSSSTSSDDEVNAAAVSTPPSSTPSSTPSPSSTSSSSTPSSKSHHHSKSVEAEAAPATTSPPAVQDPHFVYTTLITYTTHWATKFVDERGVFHHKRQPEAALHPHARRHKLHQE
ncbi:hypothetical protein NA57DRAFT_56240 [Rhizodiscina lignyota]|uniref:Uncharacterized protein n=1 Tax=Rhizodiscina lignyota TaxID=1504668 RepID=A0A9P4IEL0_9PEZI|nr:hypothetical protein NA57DRAFT_56240 [Rhizodiscina lignyota]